MVLDVCVRVCVTVGVKGSASSTWMEIKVEILDCENCHSGGRVQSLFA